MTPDHKHSLRAPWRELWYYSTIDSTQLELQRLLACDDVRGLVIQAENQTAGHGRRNRQWQSEPGGLYVSLALPRELTPPQAAAGWLPLVAALACADALAAQLELRARIKWPNDVVLEGRKIAGLLATAAGACTAPRVVLGMGMNWLNTVEGIERGDAPPAASIRDFLPGVELHEREYFIRLWLERMTWLYGLLCGGKLDGCGKLLRMAEERLFLRGARVRLREAGQADRTGRLVGLAEDAALQLEIDTGKIVSIYNGTLTAD